MKDSKYKYKTSNAKVPSKVQGCSPRVDGRQGEDVEKVSSLDDSDALWVQVKVGDARRATFDIPPAAPYAHCRCDQLRHR
eukprot:652417-Hanusia_phi.AAC.2